MKNIEMEGLFATITQYYDGIITQFPSQDWDIALAQEPEALVQCLHRISQSSCQRHVALAICKSYNFDLFDILINLSKKHNTLYENTCYYLFYDLIRIIHDNVKRREFSLMLLEHILACAHASSYHVLLLASQCYLENESDTGEQCKSTSNIFFVGFWFVLYFLVFMVACFINYCWHYLVFLHAYRRAFLICPCLLALIIYFASITNHSLLLVVCLISCLGMLTNGFQQ